MLPTEELHQPLWQLISQSVIFALFQIKNIKYQCSGIQKNTFKSVLKLQITKQGQIATYRILDLPPFNAITNSKCLAFFISIQCYPYTSVLKDGCHLIRQNTDIPYRCTSDTILKHTAFLMSSRCIPPSDSCFDPPGPLYSRHIPP